MLEPGNGKKVKLTAAQKKNKRRIKKRQADPLSGFGQGKRKLRKTFKTKTKYSGPTV